MKQQKAAVSQLVFGETIYWICVLSAIVCTVGPVIAILFVDSNIMNPHFLFASIFEGNTAQVVWQDVGGGFPRGHFWKDNLFTGDGFTQFGLALGCSVGLWALIVVAMVYIAEKNYLYVFLSVWVGLLIFLSMVGIVKGH